MSPSNLMTITDTAVYLGIKINTLYAWIHQRRIPYIKVGRLVKFDQKDIDAWIEDKKVKVRDFH